MRCGALGPETQSFPFWTVRHPACSPKGGSLLVRSSNFILLGRHCTSSPAAPCNPASREGQPRTPASPDPRFGWVGRISASSQGKVLSRCVLEKPVLGGKQFHCALDCFRIPALLGAKLSAAGLDWQYFLLLLGGKKV